MMSFPVLWTPTANRTLEKQIKYLEKKWGEHEIINFLDRVDEAIELISKNPVMYQLYDGPRRIHRCVLLSQVSLFYRIKPDCIELLVFWGNRQDPAELIL